MKFMFMIHLKVMGNETDYELLPVIAQFFEILNFIFSRSHGKLFFDLFQTTIDIFSF